MDDFITLTTAEEQQFAQARAALVDELTASGALRSQPWRQAVSEVPRHVLVPRFFRYDEAVPQRWRCVDGADPAHRTEWLAAVYRNETLVNDLYQVPKPEGVDEELGCIPTGSSTLPSLVVSMLEALDVHDGHRVLDVGTGSGYTTALLCHRLGSGNVTSVDISPRLVDEARTRLATCGYTPTLAATDGLEGYPANAPYDRIIATCSIQRIPPAWLRQTRPTGKIIVDVRGSLEGNLALLTVDDTGAASGRFLTERGIFMAARKDHQVPDTVPWPATRADRESTASFDPALFDNPAFRFCAQVHLFGVSVSYGVDRDNPDSGVSLHTSTSIAWVSYTPDATGHHVVRQGGPDNLWQRAEDAHQFWISHDRPGWDRFGLTATPNGQQIWLDTPDSAHTWELPSTP